MAISIRQANASDIPFIDSELKNFSNFIAMKHSLYPDEIPTGTYENLIDNHVLLIAHEGEVRTGFIFGFKHQHFFNPKLKCLTEFWWWVKEEYRGGRSALLLFNEFNKVGESIADIISMSLEENSPVNPKALEKRGFKLLERSFVREIL